MKTKWSRLKQRLLSGLLTASMALSLLPAVSLSASAASRDGEMNLSDDVFNTFVTSGAAQSHKISGNLIEIGDPIATREYYTTITMTSKYSIDFSQSFTLTGSYRNNGIWSGFAVSFQPNPLYDGSDRRGGFMGVYGKVTNALIAEIDFLKNTIGDGGVEEANMTGDTNMSAMQHLAIQTVGDEPTSQTIAPDILGFADNLTLDSTSMEPFSLTWNAKTKEISMSYMGNTAMGSFNPDAFWGGVPVCHRSMALAQRFLNLELSLSIGLLNLCSHQPFSLKKQEIHLLIR